MNRTGYQPPSIPPEEPQRLAALARYQLLDAPREAALDKIIRSAARLLQVPFAAISLVTEDRQYFRNNCGITYDSTPRDISFCGHTILQSEPLVIPDALEDDRFAGNPLVTGEPGIRFYVGIPLVTPDGYRIGSICAFHTQPGQYPSGDRIQTLKDLADVAVAQFGLRLARLDIARHELKQKEQQERLQASERLADVALRAGGMGFWRARWSDRNITWSPVMKTLFGTELPPSATIYDWAELVHPEDRPAALQAFFRARHRGSFHFVCRTTHPDQSIHWIAVTGGFRRSETGRLAEIVGVCHDITQVKEAKEASRRKDEMFRKLCSSSPIGIFHSDQTGKPTYVNPKVLEITDLTEDEFFSEARREIRHQDDRTLLAEAGRRMRETMQPAGVEYRIFLKNGSVRWIHVEGAPLVGEDGSYAGCIGTVMDVTERRQSLEFLKAAKDAAEAANRAKDAFVGNVSHELRTPLNGILGTSELLAQTELTPDQLDLVHVIRESGQSLLSVVNDILDVRRIENGTLAVEQVALSLPVVIEQAVAQVEAPARRKCLQLRVAYPRAFPAHFVGDPARIRQILTNYLSNAVKFTNTGTITVRVECEGRSFNKVQLRISVQDTGSGIAPDALQKLFRPFSQVDSSSTRRHGGVGLGLAISKNLAELMGGSVGVKSEVGSGSTFFLRLSLPRCKQLVPPAPDKRDSNPVEPGVKPGRLLVVEDNPVNQKVAVRLLQKLGWDVDVAHNGREALQLFQGTRYHLVLMDCQMPELDGYSATEQIRAWEAAEGRARTSIVALTAHAMTGDRDLCLRAGMDDYLAKPFQLDDLQMMLNRWAGVSAVEQESKVSLAG